MYDFPDCKYTYFSLIDKSLGHLFHIHITIHHIPSKNSSTYAVTKRPSDTERVHPYSQDHKRIHKASLDEIILLRHSYPERNAAKQSQSSLRGYPKSPCQTETLRTPIQDRRQILAPHCVMFNFSASLPQSILILPNRLNYSVPLH